MERIYNEDRLSAYFDGELPSNERAEMLERVRSTPDLRNLLDEFQLQRQLIAALPTPALSEDFTSRVMERVMAAAVAAPVLNPSALNSLALNPVAPPLAAPATPPPFPVRRKRGSFVTVIAAVLTTAATITIGIFAANKFLDQPSGRPVVVQAEKDKNALNIPNVAISNEITPKASTGEENPPDSRVEPPNSGSAIAANEPKGGVEQKLPTTETPTEILPREVGSMQKEPVEKIASSNSKSSTNALNSESNARLVANGAKAYAAATMKTRPKAYRVQIGTRSEFDSRLKDVGVTLIASKRIDPPAGVPRAQALDILPDPEYVIVEASEEKLAELISKLSAQADLALTEPKGDLEANMLIEAICKMDAAAEPLRPSDAKEEAIAGFTLPAKALRSLVPPAITTNNNPNSVAVPIGAKAPPPRDIPKPKDGAAAELYVPRVLFILDIRMNESAAPATK